MDISLVQSGTNYLYCLESGGSQKMSTHVFAVVSVSVIIKYKLAVGYNKNCKVQMYLDLLCLVQLRCVSLNYSHMAVLAVGRNNYYL